MAHAFIPHASLDVIALPVRPLTTMTVLALLLRRWQEILSRGTFMTPSSVEVAVRPPLRGRALHFVLRCLCAPDVLQNPIVPLPVLVAHICQVADGTIVRRIPRARVLFPPQRPERLQFRYQLSEAFLARHPHAFHHRRLPHGLDSVPFVYDLMESSFVRELRYPLPARRSYLPVRGVVEHYLGIPYLGPYLRQTHLAFLDGGGGGFRTEEGGEDGTEREQRGRRCRLSRRSLPVVRSSTVGRSVRQHVIVLVGLAVRFAIVVDRQYWERSWRSHHLRLR